MADSPAFVHACSELENATEFNTLEARGTVRLALKQAGLGAGHVTGAQLAVVMRQLMPHELEKRAVPDPASVCEQLAASLKSARLDEGAAGESPEAVFARLAR